MPPAIDTPSSYQNRAPGSRLASALAALLITALILFVLMELGLVTPAPPPSGTTAVMLNLTPGEKSPQATKAPAKAKSEPHKAEQHETQSHAAPAPVIKPPPTAAKAAPWNVMYMSHDEMAAADISHMPSHHEESASDAASGSASAGGQGEAGGAGGPPGPDRLFNADWYHRPSHAEMATYLPQHLNQPAWGMIACRTVPDYRVEDCRELDETPGSGVARAMREAAWQFRVLPPRINGKPVIGAWVRIRFDIDVDRGDAAPSN